MSRINLLKKKGRNIIEAMATSYEVRASMLYKALGWSRQRYYESLKSKNGLMLEPQQVDKLAEVLNITPLQLKGFLAEYYFG